MLSLHYKSYGHAGVPLVILHGLLGMLDNWQTQAKRYAEAGYKVFTLDLRNHGKSPHSDVFNYNVMANDVVHFMDEHKLSAAHLMGHSMGGKTAMQFALTYPSRVNKLVVVDVAPRKYASAHDHILDAMCSVKLGKLSTRREVDAELKNLLPDDALRQFILKNLTRDESGKLKWKVNLPVIKRAYPEIAADITVEGRFDGPTLFVKAEMSRYIQPTDETRIKKLFPRARIVSIPNAGHWVHAEQPDKFSEVVLHFLQS